MKPKMTLTKKKMVFKLKKNPPKTKGGKYV